AATAESARAARSRNHLFEVLAQRAGQAIFLRRRARGRFGPIRRGPANSRPSGEHARARLAVGITESNRRVAGGRFFGVAVDWHGRRDLFRRSIRAPGRNEFANETDRRAAVIFGANEPRFAGLG